jgi:hypothetical protein
VAAEPVADEADEQVESTESPAYVEEDAPVEIAPVEMSAADPVESDSLVVAPAAAEEQKPMVYDEVVVSSDSLAVGAVAMPVSVQAGEEQKKVVADEPLVEPQPAAAVEEVKAVPHSDACKVEYIAVEAPVKSADAVADVAANAAADEAKVEAEKPEGRFESRNGAAHKNKITLVFTRKAQ